MQNSAGFAFQTDTATQALSFPFCRGSFDGTSFLTNLTLFTPTAFDLVSIQQLPGKHRAHKSLIRTGGTKNTSCHCLESSALFPKTLPRLNPISFTSTDDILYSLFGSVGVRHKVSLLFSPENQARKYVITVTCHQRSCCSIGKSAAMPLK